MMIKATKAEKQLSAQYMEPVKFVSDEAAEKVGVERLLESIKQSNSIRHVRKLVADYEANASKSTVVKR